MESVLRATATYLFVWLVFRIAGKRSLAQITTFDAVLLLIVSEATQVALIDDDNSMTNSFLLILTLVGIDILLSVLKQRFPRLDHIMEGTATLLVDRGQLRQEWMDRERVDPSDILTAAREQQGIGSMNEIEYAVLEKNGAISVIPKRSASAPTS
jgi:uncharacterized membrane protein YcaP (DUF421 family)